MNKAIRNISILIFLILISIYSVGQSCLPDGITFNNQAQIDSFSFNYPGCKEIEGNVTITGGDISNLLGLNEITKMNGFLGILNADSLITLQGLNNLCEIDGQLWIGYYGPYGNMSLESFSGLERLKTIGQGLVVIYNPKIENFIGFDSLRYVYNLEIGGNESLTSLNGLYSLDSIDYGLIISGTENLIDLNGLSNLSFINHYIDIGYNESLVSLHGLDSLSKNSIDYYLHLINNPELSQCEAISICEYLTDSNSNVSIYNNNYGCNSPEEVIQACMVKIPNYENVTEQVSIFPNPAHDIIYIDHNKDLKINEVKIFDTKGQLLQKINIKPSNINISNLISGVYIFEIRTSNNIIRKKIIKQ
jgi:hypothetical protein